MIDASVAIRWLTRTPEKASAFALLNLYADKGVELTAPRQIVDEVGSALSKLHRRRIISAAQAQEAFQNFEDRRPLLISNADLIRSAFTLSIKHQISFWDSLYLALAIEEKADLITADQRLYRSVSRHYPFVKLLG